MVDRRFIETNFPIKEVSQEATREKNIRYGNISTLHVWWARRPLAAARAAIYAALIPPAKNKEDHIRIMEFISLFSKWESSNKQNFVKKAREDILMANNGNTPKIIDPFAGGGAIPLEAMRLGCEVYANDLNPVASLIEKATLEFPQRFISDLMQPKTQKAEKKHCPFLKDLNKYAQHVLREAKKSIGHFYSNEKENYIPVGYLWARTITCQNPLCNVEIPLLRQTWLAKRRNGRRIALKLLVDIKEKRIRFKIVEGEQIDFDPSKGTISHGKTICPICNNTVAIEVLRREAREGRMDQKLLGIILRHTRKSGKFYRLSEDKDTEIFHKVELALKQKEKQLSKKWGISAIPDEPLPPLGTLGFRVQRYGILKWGDLFIPRQKLALLTFIEKIQDAYEEMIEGGVDKNYAQAVVTYLALALDMMAAFCNSLTRWENTSEAIKHTFGRQTLSMLWDFIELCPFSGATGSWEAGWKYYLKVIAFTAALQGKAPVITQGSATNLPYPNEFFDAIVTDPPYYNYVPYADLSDFFYVWLKRTLINIYPSLLTTPLTPKSEECIQNPGRHERDNAKAKQFYEITIAQAFQEIYRVLKPNGVFILVFAHKSTEAWEMVLNGLIRAGMYLTASWPVHTEMTGRLREQQSAALASSIFLVCRKRPTVKAEIVYFNEIKAEIELNIYQKLEKFWRDQIRGSDFFISAIGPAMEIFSKYTRIERLNGEQLTIAELLEFVRKTISRFMLKKILKNLQLRDLDPETHFYILWRWLYGNSGVPFDDARKVSQAIGLELEEHWKQKSLISKEKNLIKVLGPIERAKKLLAEEQPISMIDVLHKALIYWQENQHDQLIALLNYKDYMKNNLFWEVAQALGEILPEGKKEK
ncbi:MAG: DUF1156 domain-containing protein, partial [Candidatus Hodarchaeota archaeon]